MNNERRLEIEQLSRDLLGEMWRAKQQIVNGRTYSKFQMLEPALASEFLGFGYREEPTLGTFGEGNQRFEVSGAIDMQQRLIAVSLKFGLNAARFTGGHELGHAILHPEQRRMHRDRPLGAYYQLATRDEPEIEADYFASCLLIPRKMLLEAFEKSFGVPIHQFPFHDERVARWLSPHDPNAILCPVGNLKVRAFAIANVEVTRKNITFQPLAKQFRVSAEAMAIRLEELGLRII